MSKLSLKLCALLLNLCLSSSALMESLITPLQDKIEDWKKTANQLDKDHAKGTHTSQVMMLLHEITALLSSSPTSSFFLYPFFIRIPISTSISIIYILYTSSLFFFWPLLPLLDRESLRLTGKAGERGDDIQQRAPGQNQMPAVAIRTQRSTQ